jgi:hypothetical protein
MEMNFNSNSLGGPKNKTNLFLGAIVLVIGLIFLFFIARSIFKLLSFIAPFLLILALIIDYKVVVNYLKSIWKNLQNNPGFGILMILFTVLGFPIVSAYLLGKAVLHKRVETIEKQAKAHENQFTEYEEVNDEEDFMDLKELEKLEKKSEPKNDYENLF